MVPITEIYLSFTRYELSIVYYFSIVLQFRVK